MKNISKKKIVIASMIGHILEFFDFTIYAVFALEIGNNFFPSTSSSASLISSLAILAVGFLMRPLGGALFGHIGDIKGRRFALTLSIIMMACATFCIGILPTYWDIGIMASILLVALRLVQGLCVGGEGAGASIFVLEHMTGFKHGLVGGIVNASLTIGILCAMLVGWLLHHFLPNDPNIWRYAFCFGGLLGAIGLYVRLNVDETPAFKMIAEKKKISHSPLLDVIKSNPKSIILTFIAGSVTGCSGYMVMTFIDIFYKAVMHIAPSTSLLYSIFGNICLAILLPISGTLSDRIGYSYTMLIGCMLSILSTVPIFIIMSLDNIACNFIGILLLAAIVSMIYAPLYPFVIHIFKPEHRYSGIAFSLNLGIALFGGTSSIICLKLVDYTGLLYAPALYMNCVSLLFIMTLLHINPRIMQIKGDFKEFSKFNI